MGMTTPHAKPLALLEIERKERRKEYIRSAAPTILASMVVRDAVDKASIPLDYQLETALSLAAEIYDKAGDY